MYSWYIQSDKDLALGRTNKRKQEKEILIGEKDATNHTMNP